MKNVLVEKSVIIFISCLCLICEKFAGNASVFQLKICDCVCWWFCCVRKDNNIRYRSKAYLEFKRMGQWFWEKKTRDLSESGGQAGCNIWCYVMLP